MTMCKRFYDQLVFAWSKTQKSESLFLHLFLSSFLSPPFFFLFPSLLPPLPSPDVYLTDHMISSLFLFFKVCRTGD